MSNEPVHPVAKGYIRAWLVCGPFPTGPDMLHIDHLQGVGGEENIQPAAGLEVERKDGERLGWQVHRAEANGKVDLQGVFGAGFVEFWQLPHRVGYAFARIEAATAQRLLLAIGSEDEIQLWLNGEMIHQSLASRSVRPAQEIVVADFAEGINHLLVKLSRRSGGWGFFVQTLVPASKLFVNQTDLGAGGESWEEQYLYLPDLVAGEDADVWGYVPVTNTTVQPLQGVSATVLENEILECTVFETDAIAAGETRLLPFQLLSKRSLESSDNAGLKLVIQLEGERHSLLLKPRIRLPGQYFATSYRSRVDGSIQPFRVIAPRQYDPEKSHALVLNMHGYKGDNAYESFSSRPWVFVAAANARGEVPYAEVGMWDVLEMLAAMQARYNIDVERIYLMGHSMGGRGSWHIGLHKADIFAAIAPFAGSNLPAKPLAENGLNLPTFVFHGAADNVVDVEHSREIVQIFEKLGNPVRYHEAAGAGHWWFLEEENLTACVDDPQLFDFFRRHKRHLYPHKVIHQTESLRFNKSYWTRIDQFDRHGQMARLQATVMGGNRVAVLVENISRYTLVFNDELVNMAESMIIETNGVQSFAGPAPGEVTLACHNGKWAPVAGGERRGNFPYKRPELCGPIIDAFNTPFLLVYGSGGDEHAAKTNWEEARWAQVWWQIWASGNCRIKADTALSQEDVEQYNLILYGNVESNEIVARINDCLPVRFGRGGVVAGRELFEGEDVALQMVYANPLNAERYVLLNGGVSHLGTANIHKMGLDVASDYFPSSATYDYVVFDNSFLGRTQGRYLQAGHFDADWGLQS